MNKKPQATKNFVPRNNKATFTHFLSVPLNGPEIQIKIKKLQNDLFNLMTDAQRVVAIPNDPNLFHITLSMLTLQRSEMKEQSIKSLSGLSDRIRAINGEAISVELKNLGCFRKPHRTNPGKDEYDELSIIYLDIAQNNLYGKLEENCHAIIKEYVLNEIIHEDDLKSMNIEYKNGKFRPQKMHITLFRIKEQSFKDDSGQFVKYNWRNLFLEYGDCDLGRANIPHIDISTRFEYGEDKFYKPLYRLLLADSKKEQPDEMIE